MPVLRMKIEVENVGEGMVFAKEVTAAVTKTELQQYTIPTATTEQAITFPPGFTTVTTILISSDQTISYVKTTGQTTTTVTANCPHLLTGTSLTALLINNASGSTANVKLLLGGS